MRLVYIALGWAAGIVLAADHGVPTLLWVGFAAVIAGVLRFAGGSRGQRRALAILLAVMLGGARASVVATGSAVAQMNNTGGLTLVGVVSGEPDVTDTQIQLRLAAETLTRAGQTIPSAGAVLVQAPLTTAVAYGDRIAATGLLLTPPELDTFSYADFLARRGIFSIMPNAAVDVLSTGHGNPATAALLGLKQRARHTITRHLPDPQGALLTGILLGDERGIAPEIADAFQAAGASHVIAISGFNMVILSGVVSGTLQRLRVRRGLSALLAIAVIVIYTIFVGAGAAVLRATLMSAALVIGTASKRRTYAPASLAFVVLLLSLHNPLVLWDVSFQLSFAATLGLMLFVAPLAASLSRVLARLLPRSVAKSAGDILCEPLVVTTAAQITTLPLAAWHFKTLSLVSLPVNLLIIPAQSALLITGALATLLAVVPGLAQLLYWFDLIFLSWTLAIVRLFARLPFAQSAVFVDSRFIALFFGLLLAGMVLQATRPAWARRAGHFVRRRMVLAAAGMGGTGLLILMGMAFAGRPDGRLHVWMLAMGHSNAALIQTPGGAQMLVDGGRFPARLRTALGERLPFTDREIDALFVTQPDSFDFSALTAALERYDVGVVLTNGQPNLSEAYRELQEVLSAYPTAVVRAGYRLETGDGVRVEVLHPQRQPQLQDSLNDQTLVLRLTYGEISFLLPGDLSVAGQEALLAAGHWPLATVMQLPRHGARASLAAMFLDAVQPQAIVLQSDRANRLGDPDPDTLSQLGATPLFRTDDAGTIHLWTDGTRLWVDQEG